MKKVTTAVLILAILLGIGVINARIIDKKMSWMSENISLAEEVYFAGDAQGAKKLIVETLESWEDWHKYTHIMLRHTEIELVIDGIYYLINEIESEGGATHMEYEQLRSILTGISAAEQIRWGSIL